MLSEKEFADLLARPESKTLDFKLEDYNLDKHDKKAAFIKDILAMSNTLRDESAYIILGVAETDGRVVATTGVGAHQPDERYQQIITAHVDPLPSFQYFQQLYDGKSFGVFEIHPVPQGPFSSRTHFGRDTVREGAIYWRQGSTNAEVSPFDYQQARREWDMRTASISPALTRNSASRPLQFAQVLDNARDGSEIVAFLRGAPDVARQVLSIGEYTAMEWSATRGRHEVDLFLKTYQPTMMVHLWSSMFFGSPRLTTVASMLEVVSRVEQIRADFDSPQGIITRWGGLWRATILVGRRGHLTEELRAVIVDLNETAAGMRIRTYDSVVE